MSLILTAAQSASVDGIATESSSQTITGTVQVRLDEELTASLAAEVKRVGATPANMRYFSMMNVGTVAFTAITVDGGTVDLPMGISDSITVAGASVCAAFAAAFSGAATFNDIKVTTPAGVPKCKLRVHILSNE